MIPTGLVLPTRITYKQLLVLKLSGVIEWLNEREMIIPRDTINWPGHHHTCEFFGDGRYTLRRYYENGRLYWEQEFLRDKPYGKYVEYCKDGLINYKTEFPMVIKVE